MTTKREAGWARNYEQRWCTPLKSSATSNSLGHPRRDRPSRLIPLLRSNPKPHCQIHNTEIAPVKKAFPKRDSWAHEPRALYRTDPWCRIAWQCRQGFPPPRLLRENVPCALCPHLCLPTSQVREADRFRL